MEVLKAKWDGALGSLVWWEVYLSMTGELEQDALQGSLQPKPFKDPVIL